MINNKKIIAIIPARGGSKGIPRKNIKEIAGKPLVAWTIEVAKESKLLDDFYVSTEDAEIKEISQKYGAKVIDRPLELASDTSSTWDYLKHAIEVTKADIIVLLQPTSPVRDGRLIDECIQKFIEKNADNLATGFICKLFEYGTYSANRQDLKGFFHDDGNVYIVKADLVKKIKNGCGRKLGEVSEYVITSREQNFEIDDHLDFWLNEQILKKKLEERLNIHNIFKSNFICKEMKFSDGRINAFEFEIKTHIIFGVGKILSLVEILEKESFNSVAVIIDSAVKNNENIKSAIEKIKQKGISIEIFYSEVKEEPTYDYLDEFKLKMGDNYNCIIGIGGGSTLDLSKGMATLLKNDGKSLTYRGFPKLKNKPLPVIAIPTTAGSGSDATYNAVFTNSLEKRKLGINSKDNFPIYAILDPELTLSCPETVTISSGADALVHCIETFSVKTTTPYAKMFAKEAFKLLFYNLPMVIENPKDITARGKVLLGSHFAGVATMSSGGAGLSGAMTYPLGGVFKVPHGIAGGIFLPKIVKFNVEKGFEGYWELYDIIENSEKLSNEEKNKYFAKIIEMLCSKIKIPNKLNVLGIGKDKIDFLNDYLFENLKGAVENNPITLNKEDMKKILEEMF